MFKIEWYPDKSDTSWGLMDRSSESQSGSGQVRNEKNS